MTHQSYCTIPSDLTLHINGCPYYVHYFLEVISPWFGTLRECKKGDGQIECHVPNVDAADIGDFFTLVYAHLRHKPYKAKRVEASYLLAEYFNMEELANVMHKSVIKKILHSDSEKLCSIVKTLPVPWHPKLRMVIEGEIKSQYGKKPNVLSDLISQCSQETQADIKNVQKLLFRKSREICAICTNPLSESCLTYCAVEPKYCGVELGPCDHVFHQHCIVGWLRKHGGCPLDDTHWKSVTTL